MKKRILLVAGLTFAMACLLALPFLTTVIDARFLGAPLYLGSDEAHYTVRLQEGLIHLFGNTSNGIFSSPVVHGLQPGGLEMLLGALFGWLKIPAGHLIILLTLMGAATVLPLVFLILRQSGLSFPSSCAGGVLYVFLFLGPLRRVMHQSLSLPITLLALLFVLRFWEKPSTSRAVVAGMFLGILPHIYYWSWTFLFAWTAILFLLSWMRKASRPSLVPIGILFLTTAIVALPYFLYVSSLVSQPFAQEAAERSSVIFSRGIESIPRSVLTFILAASAIVIFLRRRVDTTMLPILALAITPVIVLHQQFLHGRVISFATHYYPLICLAALVCVLYFFEKRIRSLAGWLMVGVSLLFLFAAGFDYSGHFLVHLPNQTYSMQHLRDLYPRLNHQPADVVLTDPVTALAIASNTHADVVYTEHARHLLISTKEYAERYCLSTMFNSTLDGTWIADILREPSKLGRTRETELYAQRLAIARDACVRVRKNPQAFLDQYGVTVLLWNEVQSPNWKIDPRLFRLIEKGDGWSLWNINN